MDPIAPSDLKSILHSKRANIYYLQHCRVLVNGGRVEHVTDEGKSSRYWNISIANTTTVLLGNGTSVTQAAMRELANVMGNLVAPISPDVLSSCQQNCSSSFRCASHCPSSMQGLDQVG